MRAIFYLRVSTDEQAESGAGLRAQEDACLRAAERAGWDAEFQFQDEGVSGASGLDKRPALLEALAQLGKGDVLLVAKRDRLGRDPIAVAMIEAAVTRQGARVVSAAGEGTEGDDPTNVLMRRIVDAFAEYERLVIRARTRSALAAKKARGERVGQIPYGWRLEDARIVEDPDEQATLDWIRDLADSGHQSRTIAKLLDAGKIPTKNGKEHWSPITVKRLLRRDRPGAQATATTETPRLHVPTDAL